MAGFTTWIGAGRRRLLQKWSAAFVAGQRPPSIAPIAAWFKLPLGIRIKGLKRKLLAPPKLPSVTAATPGTSPAVLPAFNPARIRKRRRKLGIQPLSAATIVARVQPQYPSWWAPKAFRTDFRRTLRRLLVPPSTPATPITSPVSAWTPRPAFKSAQNRRLQLVRPAPSTPLAPSIAPVTAWQQPRKFTQTWKFRLLRVRDHASFPATPPVPPQPVTAWLRKEPFKRHGWRDLLKLPELDRYAPTPVHPISATPAVFALVRRVTGFVLRKVLHLPSYPQAPVPPQPYTAWKAKEVFRRHGWRAQLEPLELDVRPETPVTIGGPMGRSTGVRLGPPDRGVRLTPTKRGTKGTQH